MNYTIETGKRAIKQLSSIPKRDRLKIADRIEQLADDPRPHDAKQLAGANSTYRIRSGNYRVLYEVFDKKLRVLIVQIGHRREVYR